MQNFSYVEACVTAFFYSGCTDLHTVLVAQIFSRAAANFCSRAQQPFFIFLAIFSLSVVWLYVMPNVYWVFCRRPTHSQYSLCVFGCHHDSARYWSSIWKHGDKFSTVEFDKSIMEMVSLCVFCARRRY